MSFFTNLPNEILELIFAALLGETKALHGLSISCRQLNRLTNPYLYENPHLHCRHYGHFGLTLARSTKLASLVREFSVSEHYNFPVTCESDEQARTDVLDWPDLGVQFPLGKSLRRQARLLFGDSCFGLRLLEIVLTRCKNLQYLHLPGISSTKSFIGFDFFEALSHTHHAQQPEFLENLRYLTLEVWDTDEGFANLEELLPLIAITNLPTLTCRGLFSPMGRDSSIVRTDPLRTIREFHINQGGLTRIDAENMVQQLPNLETFHYTCGSECDLETSTSLCSAAQLVQALLPLSRTLSSLRIDQSQRDWFDSDGEVKAPIGSLQPFEKLQTLEIWQCDLYRTLPLAESQIDEDEHRLAEDWVQKLPHSLEILNFVHSPTKFDFREKALLSARENLPNLRQIGVPSEIALSAGFEAILERTGIRIVDTSLSKRTTEAPSRSYRFHRYEDFECQRRVEKL